MGEVLKKLKKPLEAELPSQINEADSKSIKTSWKSNKINLLRRLRYYHKYFLSFITADALEDAWYYLANMSLSILNDKFSFEYEAHL